MIDNLSTHIRHIEEITMTALPALHTLYYDGWVLRFGRGYTRRANSVHPLYPSTLNLDEKIAHCTALYHAQGQPAIFKMTEAALPVGLDSVLGQHGFESTSTTLLQVADLGGLDSDALNGVTIERRRSERWLEAYARMNEVAPHKRDVLRQLLDALIVPAGYATIEQDGEIVSVGLGVVSQGYVGLFDIVTGAAVRGQGLGQRIVQGLMQWGQISGAQRAYLQVTEENHPAQRLYARCGFRESYRYWYRVKNQ